IHDECRGRRHHVSIDPVCGPGGGGPIGHAGGSHVYCVGHYGGGRVDASVYRVGGGDHHGHCHAVCIGGGGGHDAVGGVCGGGRAHGGGGVAVFRACHYPHGGVVDRNGRGRHGWCHPRVA